MVSQKSDFILGAALSTAKVSRSCCRCSSSGKADTMAAPLAALAAEVP
jgi:hypothetical protein